MDLRATWNKLRHNKWALGGLAAAGGLGLYMLVKKRGTGSAASSAADSTGTGTGTGVVGSGTFDSTGTDLASWLGQYQSSLQSTLQQGLQPVTDALAGLQGSGTTTGTSGATKVFTVPASYAKLGSATFDTIAHTFGLSDAQFRALNPGIANYGKVGPGSHLNVPVTG